MRIIKARKIFLRSFYISAVIAFCLFIGAYGIGRAYEEIRETGFGEYKKAVWYDGEKIRILDFEINLEEKA